MSIEAIKPDTLLNDGMDRTVFLNDRPDIYITPGIEDEIIIPTSLHGYDSSPLDKRTGTPLPIIRLGEGPDDNYHHGFFYGRLCKNQGTTKKAVRYSRLQLIDFKTHTLYHQRFDGTLYPDTVDKAFAATVLNCAGYVPEFGVFVDPKNTVVRPLRLHEREALRQPGAFRTEYRNSDPERPNRVIGHFILGYTLDQGFNDIKQLEVEEFLSISPEDAMENTELQDKKFKLALRIANPAIASSVASLGSDVQRQAFRVHETKLSPWKAISRMLHSHQPDYIHIMDKVLTDKFGAVA